MSFPRKLVNHNRVILSWPVFFYGTRERLWINDRNLLPFEANRKELGNASSLKSFRQAMVEAFTKPLVDFQFKDISTKPQLDKMNAWLDGLSEEKEKTGWDDLVSESSDPSDDADSEMETDIGHELHLAENVFIKMSDLEIDDSFGMMFDLPLYGRVISKTKKQVKAQFYSRATRTSNEYHCRNLQTHVIPVDQQGFIFYHYDKVALIFHISFILFKEICRLRRRARWKKHHENADARARRRRSRMGKMEYSCYEIFQFKLPNKHIK